MGGLSWLLWGGGCSACSLWDLGSLTQAMAVKAKNPTTRPPVNSPSWPFNDTCACVLSRFRRVQLFATLWTVACQAPLSRFSRQEYWSRLPCPPPGDLPDPGIKPVSLKALVLTGKFFTSSTTWEAWRYDTILNYLSSNPLSKNYITENASLAWKWNFKMM